MDQAELERANRWFAVECNNRAWDLASKNSRSDEENRAMMLNACASAFHWDASRNPLNIARADVLLASVFGRLGIAPQAMSAAQRALSYFEGNAATDWDLAFAHSAMAWAAAAAGDGLLHARHYLRAEELGEAIANADDRAFFMVEFALLPETVQAPKAASLRGTHASGEFSAIDEAIFAGRKIEAIKLHRQQTGVGLKEAREAVEVRQAELREKFPEKFSANPPRGCLGITVSAAAIVVGLAWWFVGRA